MRVLTPPGVAGVAVVAFAASERDAVGAVLRTPSGRPFAFGAGDGERARPRLAALVLDHDPIDEVLVVDRSGRSGAGSIELHLHGSMAVVDALRERFGEVPADPGSPATRLMRAALSKAQLDLALEQLDYERDAHGARRRLAWTRSSTAAAASPGPTSSRVGWCSPARRTRASRRCSTGCCSANGRSPGRCPA